jgi:hypothetical protein
MVTQRNKWQTCYETTNKRKTLKKELEGIKITTWLITIYYYKRNVS